MHQSTAVTQRVSRCGEATEKKTDGCCAAMLAPMTWLKHIKPGNHSRSSFHSRLVWWQRCPFPSQLCICLHLLFLHQLPLPLLVEFVPRSHENREVQATTLSLHRPFIDANLWTLYNVTSVCDVMVISLQCTLINSHHQILYCLYCIVMASQLYSFMPELTHGKSVLCLN